MVSGCVAIVGADHEADLVVAELDVPARDLVPHAGDLLVADRGLLPHRRARRRVHEEVARRVDLEPRRAVEAQADARRVGAWRHEEVVLEALLVAVELEVDAVVDAGVADPRELLGAGRPRRRIVADDSG